MVALVLAAVNGHRACFAGFASRVPVLLPGAFTERQAPMGPTASCHAIDFPAGPLTIPITTAFTAVPSNEVYPPSCRRALFNPFRHGG